MTTGPTLAVSTINLSAPDPNALARFYAELLGMTMAAEEPGWVILRSATGGIALSFQSESYYTPPVWPPNATDQQMMMHLEIRTDDLAAAVDHAVGLGATLAEFQPQEDVRVCIDPAGHPFCVWVG
jgi:catechol 2,3-dioxygenase-like lactoylglutathione lyase family enzyme